MSIRNLIPRLGRDRAPARREREGSLTSFQRDMNRLFDDFFGDFGLEPAWGRTRDLSAFAPNVNVAESDKEVTVTAELPGMDEKDITLELDENTLTLRGEKKEENEESGKDWHRVESRYGSFHRVIALPARVDGTKAKARFKKGVLSVALPKLPEEHGKRKQINIVTD